MPYEAATSTNPNIVPNENSENTGIGGISGELSLINGGVETINMDAANNVTIPNGNLTVSEDTNASTILGRCRIDSRGNDQVFLSHYNHTSITQYAFRVTGGGYSIFNSLSGSPMDFRINDDTKMRVESGGDVLLTSGNDFKFSSNSDGVILIDRTTATSYRLYVDSGSLLIELV